MNTRKILNIILSCSLYLSSPMPFSMAQAAEQTGSGINFNDVAGAMSTAIDVAGKTILQSKQQQHQFNMMMLSYKNMNFNMQFTPAKYFPHCAITPAQMDYPEHACEKISSPTELTQAEMLSKLAFSRVGVMDQMTSTAQNSSNPVGIQCLQDAKSKQLVAMQDKLNSLKTISNNVKKNNQLFRDQNKALLESMKAVNDELTGSKNSSSAPSIDVSKNFQDSACSEVLTRGAFDKGLRGVRDSMTTPQKDGKGLVDLAKNVIKDEASIKNQIQMQKERILKTISSQGVDQGTQYLLNTNELSRGGLTSFPAVKASILRKGQELQASYSRIKTELEKNFPGYTLPTLDKHFATTINNFSKDAGNYFKKKMIDDCVTMKDQTGLGLTRDQILSSLKQKSTGSSGTTTTSYKKRLAEILASDAFIEDKISQIKALDEKFGKGNITVTLDTSSGRKNYTVYEMFQETIARCEARYNQDNTFSKDSANTSSQAQTVAQAQKYINELRDLEKNYASDLATEITDELISCTGKAKEKSGSCDSARMDATNENFCVSSAVSCANNVNSCYQRAEAIVKDREAVLKGKANLYNQNVNALISQQELYLKQVQARVFADTEFFKNYFPNSGWKMPDDLFVKLPELSSGAQSGLGTELLRNGGNQDFLEDLPKKLESLAKVLEEQREKISRSIDEYINNQAQAMEKNKSNWKNVAETCLAAAKGYREQVTQAQAKAAEDKTKAETDASEFCSRYSDLTQSNPAPGCSGSNSPDNLFTDATKISAYLDPSVQTNITDYKNLCAEVQSEKTSKGGDNEVEAVEVPGIVDLCEEEGDSWSNAKDRIVEQMISQIPSSISDKKNDIEEYLTNTNSEKKLDAIIGTEAARSAWGRSIEKLKTAFKNAADTDPSSYSSDLDSMIKGLNCSAQTSNSDECTAKETNLKKIKAKMSSTKGICGTVKNASLSSAVSECVDKKYSSSCISEKQAASKKDISTVSAEAGDIDRVIKKVTSQSTKDDIMKRWSEIGERFGGACKAGAGGTYQNRFLGEFQKTLDSMPGASGGAGATQGLY